MKAVWQEDVPQAMLPQQGTATIASSARIDRRAVVTALAAGYSGSSKLAKQPTLFPGIAKLHGSEVAPPEQRGPH